MHAWAGTWVDMNTVHKMKSFVCIVHWPVVSSMHYHNHWHHHRHHRSRSMSNDVAIEALVSDNGWGSAQDLWSCLRRSSLYVSEWPLVSLPTQNRWHWPAPNACTPPCLVGNSVFSVPAIDWNQKINSFSFSLPCVGISNLFGGNRFGAWRHLIEIGETVIGGGRFQLVQSLRQHQCAIQFGFRIFAGSIWRSQ